MLGSMVTVLCLSLAMVFVVEGYQNAYDKPLSVSCPNGRGIDRIKVRLKSFYRNVKGDFIHRHEIHSMSQFLYEV